MPRMSEIEVQNVKNWEIEVQNAKNWWVSMGLTQTQTFRKLLNNTYY